MKTTQELHDLGQSIWLDNISRGMLTSGALRRYVNEYSVTGLTSNPTIFDQAIRSQDHYDQAIRDKALAGTSTEALFYELALEDLTQAAELFRPTYERTSGMDGWASLEMAPSLADDAEGTTRTAQRIYAQADCPNLFIKIPGTRAGMAAIEETTFAGVPVNVTLLFSREQYLAAAQAYLRGIERRIAAGLAPGVHSVASLFVSRWDKAVIDRVPAELHNRLGIAIAMRTYKAYRELFASERWRSLARAGAPAQRLLFASTGTKDPKASDILYVEALAAPDTINTMPEKTLLAYADHGKIREVLPADGGYAEDVLAEFRNEGIDDDDLAEQLLREGTEAFAKSWNDLMSCIESKAQAMARRPAEAARP